MAGYDPNQPRDEKGQWAAGDGGIAIKAAASDLYPESQMKLFELPEPTKPAIVTNDEDAKAAIEKVKDKLTEDEIIAVDDYSRTGYIDINNGLRENDGDVNVLTGEAINTVNGLDKFFSNNEIPRYQGVTYRGMAFSSEERYTDFRELALEGAIFEDQGYTSTSTSEYRAQSFATTDYNYSVVIEVEGNKGIFLNGLSNAESEYEVLYPRSTRYHVVSADEEVIEPEYESEDEYIEPKRILKLKLKAL